MMQSNELRAGNKLITPEGKIVSVDPLMIMDLWQCEQAKNVGAFRYSPIPLTAELLEGVDWEGYVKFHFNSYFSIDDVGHFFYHNDYTGINIDYLHQLQNMYFAITGKELSITT